MSASGSGDEPASLAAAAHAVCAAVDGVGSAVAAEVVRAAVDPHERRALAARYRRLAALVEGRPGVLTGGRHPGQLSPPPHRSTAGDAVRVVAELARRGHDLAPLRWHCPAGHPLAHRHWLDPCRGGCPWCLHDQALHHAAAVLAGTLPALGCQEAAVALCAAVEGTGGQPNAPRLRRLAALLEAEPELLSSGRRPTRAAIPVDCQALGDLGRLAATLTAAGHPTVKVLAWRCDAGHPQDPRWSPSRGCPICSHDAAIGDAVAATLSCLPALDAEAAEAALVVAVGGGSRRMVPSRLGNVAAYLRSVPDALTSGGSSPPPDVARLIDRLAGAGAPGVVAPRCAGCGRQGFLKHPRGDGERICVSCFARAVSKRPCARCGTLRRVQVDRRSGEAICEVCRYADPANQRPCELCGRPGRIQVHLGGKAIGSCCYLHPHERCSVCGLARVANPYKAGAKATCAACAAGALSTCKGCGLDAPPPDPAQEATCLRCAAGATAECAGCGELTVMTDRAGVPRCWHCYQRPEGTCGRCGRCDVVIVRLATGDDPDLCHSCWKGPVVACERCGRVRPCRGERTGRMLCAGCRPHRKVTCAYCGARRTVSATWAAGPACNACYRVWHRAKSDCASCGAHRRVLPYRGFDRPVCAPCAGAPPGPVCGACGNEDWLYRRGRCARCVLVERLGELLGDQDARAARGLQALFEVLSAAEAPESVIGWLRPGQRAAVLLGALGAGELTLAHDRFDALAHAGTSANQLQALLVAIGSLPERDPQLARLEHQLGAYLDTIDDNPRRQLLAGYARWRLLRRARAASERGGLSPYQRHSATASLRAANRLCDWLAGQGLDIDDLDQVRLDAYLIDHATQRNHLAGFLAWAHRQRRVPRLELYHQSRPITVVPVAQDQRWELARHLLHDSPRPLAHRVAALLVLLFAQDSARIAALSTGHVDVDADKVRLRLGDVAIDVPEPLDRLLADLVAGRTPLGRVKAAGPDPWLFPGRHPGRPADPHSVRRWVRACGVTPMQPHRASALIDLTGQLPAPVVAELLGIAIGTAVKWSTLAGRPWGQYLGLLTPPR